MGKKLKWDALLELAKQFSFGVTHDPEDGKYIVRFPEFPRVLTHGDDPVHATQMAIEGMATYLEGLQIAGKPLPKPAKEFTGRLSLRVPRELHRELEMLATQRGVKLNKIASEILREGVAAKG